jgi:gamma-glutamylcyclotransferase (GGCT)/AIG2-like uncharacterized protein YtfP
LGLENPTVRLFVYGTLRRGQSAAHLLQTARFLSTATIRAQRAQNGIYSGLVPGDDAIEGELYEIPAALFPVLDEYEGDAFVRREVDTSQDAKAWVYFNR